MTAEDEGARWGLTPLTGGLLALSRSAPDPVSHPWCPYLLSSVQHPLRLAGPLGRLLPAACHSQCCQPCCLGTVMRHLPVTKEKPKLDNENSLDKGL